jgi:(2Fe-2S) ferredoxin
MSHFNRHLFICCNERPAGEVCCERHGASALFQFAKEEAKRLAAGPDVRVNKAGCLGRCEEGPVAVVYPEGVWYTFVDREDIAEIVAEHLIAGRVVERLKR